MAPSSAMMKCVNTTLSQLFWWVLSWQFCVQMKGSEAAVSNEVNGNSESNSTATKTLRRDNAQIVRDGKMATTFILPKSRKNHVHAGIAKDLTSLLVCCGQHACAWTVRLDMPRLPWPRFRTALKSGSDLRATPGHSTSASGRRKAGLWSWCCLLQGCLQHSFNHHFFFESVVFNLLQVDIHTFGPGKDGRWWSLMWFSWICVTCNLQDWLHQDLFLHPVLSQALVIAMNYPGTAAERKCAGNDLDKVTGILLR